MRAVRSRQAGLVGSFDEDSLVRTAGLLGHRSATIPWGTAIGRLQRNSLTGIYLWFQLRQERVTGAILIALCCAFSLTLIILLRTA